MEQVWIVTANSSGDENDQISVIGVFDRDTAKQIVKEQNAGRVSSYETEYFCEEFKFNDKSNVPIARPAVVVEDKPNYFLCVSNPLVPPLSDDWSVDILEYADSEMYDAFGDDVRERLMKDQLVKKESWNKEWLQFIKRIDGRDDPRIDMIVETVKKTANSQK